MLQSEKKIKRKRSGPERDKRNLYHYVVKDHDLEHDVCRKAFISVYGISDETVRQITRNRQHSTTGTPIPDCRGRGVLE